MTHQYTVRIGTQGSKQEEVYHVSASNIDQAEKKATFIYTNTIPNPEPITYIAASMEK